MSDTQESCASCRYCHELWHWNKNEYPKNKQFGYCCTFFHDIGEDVVMQLFGIEGPGQLCEAYVEK